MTNVNLNEEQLERLLDNHVHGLSLRNHCLAVAAIMEGLARHLNKDYLLWKTTGLLHDIDAEYTKGGDNHGTKGAQVLAGEGFPQEVLDAIRCHTPQTLASERSKTIDIALAASDHIAGLIISCVLRTPSRKLRELTSDKVILFFKKGSLPKSIDRDSITAIQNIGLSIEIAIEIGIERLKGISEQLRL